MLKKCLAKPKLVASPSQTICHDLLSGSTMPQSWVYPLLAAEKKAKEEYSTVALK